MPLHSQDRERGVDESFDHVVPGAADGNQSFADAVNRLMVGGVYFGVGSIELIKEIAPAEITVKDIMEPVAADPAVSLGGVDMLRDAAAEMNIDELESLADAEHRLFLCGKEGQCLQLQDIEGGVYVKGAMVCLAEKGGRDIAASGEEQVCRAVCRVGVCCREVRDIHTFQSDFIVSGILFVTKDGNGWAFVHSGPP